TGARALVAYGSADAEEVAGRLGLPVALLEAVCDEPRSDGAAQAARTHRSPHKGSEAGGCEDFSAGLSGTNISWRAGRCGNFFYDAWRFLWCSCSRRGGREKH